MSIRPYLADCGIRTTDAKKQVHPLEGSRARLLPTLEGKQIGRYWCLPPEVGVKLDAGDVFKSKEEKYSGARFLIRQTAAYPIVGPHDHATHFRNSLHALFEPTDSGLDVRYLVGLLNSKVVRYAYVKMIREARQRTFPQVKLAPLGQLPIRRIDPRRPAERAIHDRVVDLVEALVRLQRRALSEKNEARLAKLREKSRELDISIDREVYALYELSDEEIDEVEKVLATVPVPPAMS